MILCVFFAALWVIFVSMEFTRFKEIIESLKYSMAEIKKRDYKEFLELIQLNDQIIKEWQKHNFPKALGAFKPGPYIYPVVKKFENHVFEIANEASLEQQMILVPLMLQFIHAFDNKVIAFQANQPKDIYLSHLDDINNSIKVLATADPLKSIQEQIDNAGAREYLLDIIKRLKYNISHQTNGRKTDTHVQWKRDLFTEIENKLLIAGELLDSERLQYIADIRGVCGRKRNSWHLWSEPHSVAEFEVMLLESPLTKLSNESDNIPCR